MNEKDIRKLIAILEESNVNEIEISEGWGKSIKIVKNGGGGVYHAPQLPVPQPDPQKSSASVESSKESTDSAENSKNNIAKSPMVGTFYRSPAPDEPSFVSVGDTVKKGQTLCIIEAMKVMNEIESEFSGKILEILVDNASPVEFNHNLFVIEPG